jgi:hypothetical protein
MAAEEMVETVVVLEVDNNSISAETWAATAGPTDIIQLVQSTTATTALPKRMGTKTEQPPQIAWVATTSGHGRKGQAFPAQPRQLQRQVSHQVTRARAGYQ